MQELVIQNFGPIANRNKVNLKINKVTVFCGMQGSGKSSIAKLLSTFLWLEKALVRGDFDVKELTAKNFREKYCAFHNIQNYFKTDTFLYFKGTKFVFTYENGKLGVKERAGMRNFVRPQVMYIPSERNLMTALDNAEDIRNLSGSLSVLLDEYTNALRNATKPFALPLNGFKVTYDKSTNTAWLNDSKFKIKLTEAASGFQSMVPMVIVSRYLFNKIKENKKTGLDAASGSERRKIVERVAKLLKDSSLSSSMRATLIKQLHAGYFNGRLVNIVEEPEQNLYPETQRNVLNELLKVNNELALNQLVLTTHSPYMLNYLTLAIKAGLLKDEIKQSAQKQDGALEKMDSIVPRSCAVLPKKVVIYEILPDGEIQILDNYDGIPSDLNFLNSALNKTNDLFDALLEIQDEVQA